MEISVLPLTKKVFPQPVGNLNRGANMEEVYLADEQVFWNNKNTKKSLTSWPKQFSPDVSIGMERLPNSLGPAVV